MYLLSIIQTGKSYMNNKKLSFAWKTSKILVVKKEKKFRYTLKNYKT